MNWLTELATQYNCNTMMTQRKLNYIPAIYDYLDGKEYSDADWECLEEMRYQLAFEMAAGDWLCNYN